MRVHHIGYLTKRLCDSETAFLALGWRVEQAAAFDPLRRANISFLSNGAYRVELIEPCGKDSPLYPLLRHYRNTPYHVCYAVADLTAGRVCMEKNGCHVIREREVAPCLGGRNVAFFMHPDAGMIELVEDTHVNEYTYDEIVPLNYPPPFNV